MKTLFTTCLLALASIYSFAEVVVISGVYQGKDLYVQNPTTSSGVGFCVFEVLVNNNITSDEVNSPAFAVDLAAWGLKINDPVEVILRCKEKCEVKIINPQVIYPNSTFEVVSMAASADGMLTWTTKNESSAIPYIIEQFRWNRWMKVGEIMGKGNIQNSDYAFQAKLHSGLNTFRIYQIDHKGQRVSQEVKVESATPAVNIKSTKINNTIDFSAETDFEIYSEYGSLVKSGRAATVDASKFFKGKYYVSFDNKAGAIVEKK
jgi:hypothetical protein